MASEPDDNPFARNSAWPKMPQAPFRVGALPRVDGAPAPPSGPRPEPPPAKVTPVFVRPVAAAESPGLVSGGAVPHARPQPAPPWRPEPAPPTVEAPAVAVAPPPVAAPEPSFVEVAPLIVRPVGSEPRKAVRRSAAPVWAAAAVGAIGLAGLAFLFTRGQQAAPPAPAAPSVAVVSAPQPAPLDPPPAAPLEASVPAPAPAAAPTQVVAARRIPVIRAPARAVPSEAATATEEAISAPLISLPPAGAAAPAPPPEPLPAYTPRAAPDPNAPITTRRPY